jgi:hypothetical protein
MKRSSLNFERIANKVISLIDNSETGKAKKELLKELRVKHRLFK